MSPGGNLFPPDPRAAARLQRLAALRAGSLTAAACLLCACAPDLGASGSLIASATIVAVRADPAEAKPGAAVTFTALVASPSASVGSPQIVWDFCSAPRPLTTDDVVSPACVEGTSLVAAGQGASITANTPVDGCSLFGPDTAAEGLRPVDPDATGGYYQPLIAELPRSDTTVDLVRITCDLAGASAATVTAFAAAYVPNANPQLLPLTATIGGAPASLASVPAGGRVKLEASWPSASAQTYAYYDAASDTITMQREALSVAWYSSAGALDSESTGRAAGDLATTSDNGYTAPSAAGIVHLWIVLRDSRGGVDFATYQLDVTP